MCYGLFWRSYYEQSMIHSIVQKSHKTCSVIFLLYFVFLFLWLFCTLLVHTINPFIARVVWFSIMFQSRTILFSTFIYLFFLICSKLLLSSCSSSGYSDWYHHILWVDSSTYWSWLRSCCFSYELSTAIDNLTHKNIKTIGVPIRSELLKNCILMKSSIGIILTVWWRSLIW